MNQLVFRAYYLDDKSISDTGVLRSKVNVVVLMIVELG